MTELNKELSNSLSLFKQSDGNYFKNYENIRSLESPLSLLIDILITLIKNKKIEYFKEFLNKEILYLLTQVYTYHKKNS